MANSVDPDKMANDEPSHHDLHCVPSYLVWSAKLKNSLDVCFITKSVRSFIISNN